MPQRPALRWTVLQTRLTLAFALDSGGATGVALKIKTSGGEQQYPSSTDSTPVEHTVWFDGTNKLNYIASYVPVKPDATVGTANATVNFSVTYE